MMYGTAQVLALVAALPLIGAGCGDGQGETTTAQPAVTNAATLELCEDTTPHADVVVASVEIVESVLSIQLDASGQCPIYRACWDGSFREEVPAGTSIRLRDSGKEGPCDGAIEVDLRRIEQSYRDGYPGSPGPFEVSLRGWKEPILIDLTPVASCPPEWRAGGACRAEEVGLRCGTKCQPSTASSEQQTGLRRFLTCGDDRVVLSGLGLFDCTVEP